MKFKTIATGLTAMVLATVLVPIAASTPAVAQSQTSWHVNDNPSLLGPSEFWYRGDAGRGYGSNNYRYTYAIGGAATANNWARWNTGSRVGRQEIQVYVPSDHATATVNYNISIGGSTSKRAVQQRNISGWHSLGNWNTNGANVVIAVYDNDAEQHHQRDGLTWSSIGVDAIRMRCISNCGTTSPPPPPPPEPPGPPSVSARIDESSSGRTLVASWSPPSDNGGSRITGYTVTISRPGRTFGPYERSASSRSFRITGAHSDTTYTVRVVAKNRYGSGPQASDSVRTPVGSSPPPGPPQNIRMRVEGSSSSRTVVASWSPPSDNGGSRITGYTVTISRPGRTFGPYERSASSRRFRITGAHSDTTYTVRVVAKNRHGSGRQASNSVRTPAQGGSPPPPPTPTYPYLADVAQGCTEQVDKWNAIRGQCTSYVAFRLNEAGIQFHNNYYTNGRGNVPCAGNTINHREGQVDYCKWGNAKNWDDRAGEIGIDVDDDPQPGAVAQWEGASELGHVAYVERVNDDGSIIISDMNWSNPPRCNLRQSVTLRRDSGTQWPSNFIHFETANSGSRGRAQYRSPK